MVSLYLLSCLLCCYLVLYVCSRGPEYFFKGLVVCVFPRHFVRKNDASPDIDLENGVSSLVTAMHIDFLQVSAPK